MQIFLINFYILVKVFLEHFYVCIRVVGTVYAQNSMYIN